MKQVLLRLNNLYYLISFLFIVCTIYIISGYKSHDYNLNTEEKVDKKIFYSRDQKIINTDYSDSLNYETQLVSQDIKKIFISIEDKRFFTHNGVDWIARARALLSNFINLEIISGASTITEQVVRIINPRPRNYISKLYETIDAYKLEKKYSKEEILHFYLNQVPYSSNKRGVVDAAKYYFNRSVNTLSIREKIALAVLIRAPSRLNPHKNLVNLEKIVDNEIKTLCRKDVLTRLECNVANSSTLEVDKPGYDSFLALRNYLNDITNQMVVETTIDLDLQKYAERILNKKVQDLSDRDVNNGAILIVNHKTGDIISYVVAGQNKLTKDGSYIDVIREPRQPGSTLKPFLYAKYFDVGNTHVGLVADSPIDEKVNLGIHSYNNYSNRFYGLVSYREALANSLNTPAVRTIDKLGVGTFYNFLNELNISSLKNTPDYYGNGLALGNAEISLFELVQAYTIFPNEGRLKNISILKNYVNKDKSIIKKSTAFLLSDILSDPAARELEFGLSSKLEFTSQTAIKTGTSTDFRDAWAIGYDSNYIVGIWMGNTSYKPMREVNGSLGPASLLKPILNRLNLFERPSRFKMPRNFISKNVCLDKDNIYLRCDGDGKKQITEIGLKENFITNKLESKKVNDYEIKFPKDNLIFALDPRVPISDQQINFELSKFDSSLDVKWFLDGKAHNGDSWTLKEGRHSLSFKLLKSGKIIHDGSEIEFTVVK